jgi:hypothetical protein
MVRNLRRQARKSINNFEARLDKTEDPEIEGLDYRQRYPV